MNQIVIYQPNEQVKVDVRFESDTVWLTQPQIAQLFQCSCENVRLHLKNIYKIGELDKLSTSKDFLEVRMEGGREVTRKFTSYNLEAIISVGFRVNSVKGVQFRQWVNRIVKERSISRANIEQRVDSIEQRLGALEVKLDNELPEKEKLFFEGQIFDAHNFFCDLIRGARKRVIVIDNYVDDSVLTRLDKRTSGVEALIYTGRVTKQLQLDVARHNEQYPPIAIRHCSGLHDRFLVIDKTLYHVGASLKDAGRKTFAVMKMSLDPSLVLPATL